MLKAERGINQRMAPLEVASEKKEEWVAKDLLSALREDFSKRGSRHVYVHATCVPVTTHLQGGSRPRD